MTGLPVGKVPIDVLRSTFLRMTGARSADIVTPASVGLDFAAVRVGKKFMVVSSDPVTGVVENIGRYAIDVNANDVSTSGNRPQFAESVVLLPEGADVNYVKRVASQMDVEAKRLGISILGGHTEVTPGLRAPIVSVTAFSIVDDFVSSREAKAGDTILMTKTAGLEGTAVLTGASGFLKSLSVVEEAVAAYRTGLVHAMHDCTEGGVLGAVFEMSVASGLGFELEAGDVPVAPLTLAVCKKFEIDPLKLIGSGSLLISVPRKDAGRVAKAVSAVCKVTKVGEFVKKGRTLVRGGGLTEKVRTAPEDELWRALSKSARGGHRT